MEKLQQIKLFLFSVFFSFNLFSQENKLKVIINDSVEFKSNKSDLRNASIDLGNAKVLDLSYWPSKCIGLVLVKRKENLYLKLGFNYSGDLINKSEYIMLNDSLIANGNHFFYDDNGKLTKLYTYKDGKMNGKFISYYENGFLQVLGYYVDDEKKGKWIYYDKKGKILKVKMFPPAAARILSRGHNE